MNIITKCTRILGIWH